MAQGYVRKLSVIGLILTTVSAITAFIYPSVSRPEAIGIPGTLAFSTHGHNDLTCIPLMGAFACTVTLNSTTTGPEGFSSEPLFGHSNSSSEYHPDGDGNTTVL